MYSQRQVRREIVRVNEFLISKVKRKNYNLPRQVTLNNIKNEILNLSELRDFRKKAKPKEDILLTNRHDRFDKVMEKYISYARFYGNYEDMDEGDMRYVAEYSGEERMALVKVNSWINYTRSYGTYVRMTGLVLFDKDSKQYRFLRVGPNVNSIISALEYIKPAEVRKAEAVGKEIKRQGDIYFIPQRTWNLNSLSGTNHNIIYNGEKWDGKTKLNGNPVTISHPTHGNLVLDIPHKAVQQIIVANVSFRYGGGRISGHAD